MACASILLADPTNETISATDSFLTLRRVVLISRVSDVGSMCLSSLEANLCDRFLKSGDRDCLGRLNVRYAAVVANGCINADVPCPEYTQGGGVFLENAERGACRRQCGEVGASEECCCDRGVVRDQRFALAVERCCCHENGGGGCCDTTAPPLSCSPLAHCEIPTLRPGKQQKVLI